ncbi:LysR family transcriptional regulator [Acidisphaera sp. S103]|uniref:LysR family transcriptional regulator n=1 Tax=Acidisphaera sp. S103 TaxID=1747223 RepID=UPI00131CCB58|nr:LysR family transcriptional regulator [Acidisphaera sp. S103]
MFEFNQLRCFVAVAENLHFGRAAQRLNMTQPPLSRQIQLLEHDLGVTLFERTSRSVQLTQAGRAFLPEARQMLMLAEGAAVAARRVAQGAAGSITLGFTAGSSYGFLPRLVALTTAEMPDVDLVLREMITARQMEALAADRLDAGLVRLPVDRRGNELVCVLREPLVLAAPENHPMARGEAPGLRDLDHVPFIMYAADAPTEGRYFHDLTTGLFRTANITPRFVQHVSQIHAILALVSAGMGVSLVPRSAGNLLARGVVLRDLRPVPRTPAELQLIWRRGKDNPALLAFREKVLPKLSASDG